MTRSFTIVGGVRVPPRRWWTVRIYDTVAGFRAAAGAYGPGVDFSEALGCCQHARWIDDQGGERFAFNGFGGVLRFCSDHLTGEIVAHELCHAAVATYRMNVARDVQLGESVTEQEEQFAYIYGELYASFEQRHRP